LDKIGQQNVESLRSLLLSIHAVYEEDSESWWAMNISGHINEESIAWRALFERLSEMKHLRKLMVTWDAEFVLSHHMGAGWDVRIVRALGKMNFLDSLEISGYFAKEWPGYLSARVQGLQIEDDPKGWRADYQRRLGNLLP